MNSRFIVSRENVLQTYRLVQSEFESLSEAIEKNGFKLRIDACGEDPVSKDAMETFNPKLDKIRAQATDYLRGLASDAEQLKRTAQSYGFTEEEITRSMASPPAEREPNPSRVYDALLRPPNPRYGPR